jgi:hypothetical protein
MCQAPAPRQVLLDRGDRAQDEHRAGAGEAHAEHHEHERPAAADAEGAVGDAHPERLGAYGRAPPTVDHEAERTAAFVEAPIAQWTELPQPGGSQRGPDDQLGVFGEPREGVDGGMDPAVADPGGQPERAPYQQVPEQEQRDQPARMPPTPHQGPEGDDERHARGQHHGHDHQEPADGEQERLEGDRAGPAGVVQERPIRRPLPHG